MPNEITRCAATLACMLLGVSFAAFGQQSPREPTAGPTAEPAELQMSVTPAPESSLSDVQRGVINERKQLISGYEDLLDDIQKEYGVYDSRLTQELVSLGLAYQAQGEHDDALKAFKRAWHVDRVNAGLYSKSQMGLLEHIIDSHAALEDWRAVADDYDYLHWVYKRNHEPNDPELLPIIKRLRRWHVHAYNRDTGRALTEHFYAADDLYNQGIEIIESHTGKRELGICFWHPGCCDDDETVKAARCPRQYR